MGSKMWEVDPETRSKLLEISKTNENNRCVDCGAPSPQWASPKFGIFFCLACSGIHRSLGVHISFVRSVTMDAFKHLEVQRMQLGGNRPWKDFFNNHASNKMMGRDFDSCTIAERYDSEAGEEWKERLTCRIEGTEYVPGAKKPSVEKDRRETGITPAGSGRNTPTPSTTNVRSPPPQNRAPPGQKARNEAYFAAKGEENALRPEGLAPSQGGKYAGFGSAPPPSSTPDPAGIPTSDEFQRDPMAALTKGFGWLSSTVSKQAASVNKSYIQPGMKSFAEGDFAAQARATAAQAGSYVQQGARGVNDQFNKFVDPDYSQGSAPGGVNEGGVSAEKKGFWDSFGQAPAGPPREKQDFWDSFGQDPSGPPREKKAFWDDFAAAGEVANQSKAAPKSSIGTSAMKAPGGATGGTAKKAEGEGWGDW